MPEVPPFLWSDAGTFPSPKLYKVPGAGEVMPYTATATYVNASGQAILPALRIKSAEGALLSLTFPVGSTIANGASSEVTFVPPFGSAQGSAAASTSEPFAVAYRSGWSVPGTNPNIAPWDSIRSTGSEIDLDAGGFPQINEQGLYLMIGTVQIYDTTWAAPVHMTFDLVMVTGGAGNSLQNPPAGEMVAYPGWNDQAGDYNTQLNMISYANVTTPPEQYRWRILFVFGSGGHDATGTYASTTIQRLGDHSPAGV